MQIIDVHTHTFPTKESGITWQKGQGIQNPARAGTIEDLNECMSKGNISHAVMLMYTPTRFMYEARIKRDPLPADPTERAKREQELKELMAQRMIQNNEWACETISKQNNRWSQRVIAPPQ